MNGIGNGRRTSGRPCCRWKDKVDIQHPEGTGYRVDKNKTWQVTIKSEKEELKTEAGRGTMRRVEAGELPDTEWQNDTALTFDVAFDYFILIFKGMEWNTIKRDFGWIC